MSLPQTPISPPSSAGYAAELHPSGSTRIGVLASAWLLLLVGAVIVLHSEISILVRVLALAAWLWGVGRGIARLARGQARVRRLRLLAELLDGSAVGRAWAWLRFRFDDGLVYAELLWVRQVEASAWRRLQVIWRWGQ